MMSQLKSCFFSAMTFCPFFKSYFSHCLNNEEDMKQIQHTHTNVQKIRWNPIWCCSCLEATVKQPTEERWKVLRWKIRQPKNYDTKRKRNKLNQQNAMSVERKGTTSKNQNKTFSLFLKKGASLMVAFFFSFIPNIFLLSFCFCFDFDILVDNKWHTNRI